MRDPTGQEDKRQPPRRSEGGAPKGTKQGLTEWGEHSCTPLPSPEQTEHQTDQEGTGCEPLGPRGPDRWAMGPHGGTPQGHPTATPPSERALPGAPARLRATPPGGPGAGSPQTGEEAVAQAWREAAGISDGRKTGKGTNPWKPTRSKRPARHRRAHRRKGNTPRAEPRGAGGCERDPGHADALRSAARATAGGPGREED